MSEILKPDVTKSRELKGSQIYIRNRPPVRPIDMLGGMESFVAGNLYKAVEKKHPDEQADKVREVFYTGLVEKSHVYDPSILRWQTLRQNPVGDTNARLTGFEGYYVGSGLTPDEIVRSITQQGTEILKALPGGLKREVFKTLQGQGATFPAVLWLSAEFGALLGKYRAMRSLNNEAKQFRAGLPDFSGSKIQYNGDTSVEQFAVPVVSGDQIFQAHMGDIQDPGSPYGLMHKIGQLGHPFYRAIIGSIDPEEMRYLQYKPAAW